jgi:hypothetical protein
MNVSTATTEHDVSAFDEVHTGAPTAVEDAANK